ncbi:unnamed protein product, partial [Allacma fusca]
FTENGISPTEVPRVRLDGGPNSVKCLINNSKWGMNPVMEEEEESSAPPAQPNAPTSERDKNKSTDQSSNGSNPMLRNSSPISPLGKITDFLFLSYISRTSA